MMYDFKQIGRALGEKTSLDALSKDYEHTDIGFHCNCCGVCCEYAGLVAEELDNGTGRCKHLGEDRLCKVYDNRPLVCNVGSLYEILFKDKVSKEQYLCDQYKACEMLCKLKHDMEK